MPKKAQAATAVATKRKPGRPAKPADEKQTTGRISAKFNAAEAAEVQRLAAERGLPVSEWVRRRSLGEDI